MSRIYILFFIYILFGLSGCGTNLSKSGESLSFSDNDDHAYLQQDVNSDDWMRPLQQTSLKLLDQEISLNISDQEIESYDDQDIEDLAELSEEESISIESLTTTTRNANIAQRYKNLWDRLPAGYELTEQNDRVQHYIDYYAKHANYFKQLSKNARPYLHFIVEEIEKRGLPMELAFIPAVESAFKPNALSHRHAAGLWQFTPGTGKNFGLRQNRWYDARRDVVASTQAALDYLEYLNKLFDGDWLVAIAAYNWGEGNVKRAIKKNQRKGMATNYWSLGLPKETRQYIPKLLAIAHIVAHRARYNIALAKIKDRPYLEQIQLTSNSQIDLFEAAEMAGLSKSEFKNLNSGYRRGVTDPRADKHIVTLPVGKARNFKRKLAQIPTKAISSSVNAIALRDNRDNKEKTQPTIVTRSKSQYHRIQRGETLATVAKTYDVTVQTLRQLNKNINARSLKVGQRIRLPNKDRVTTEIPVVSTPKSNKIVHTVQLGENLWQIAKSYKISIDNLTKWNSLSKNTTLKRGQRLTIWADG